MLSNGADRYLAGSYPLTRHGSTDGDTRNSPPPTTHASARLLPTIIKTAVRCGFIHNGMDPTHLHQHSRCFKIKTEQGIRSIAIRRN